MSGLVCPVCQKTITAASDAAVKKHITKCRTRRFVRRKRARKRRES